jgi:hypothetical protein
LVHIDSFTGFLHITTCADASHRELAASVVQTTVCDTPEGSQYAESVTDEHADAGPKTDVPDSIEPDDDRYIDEIMALIAGETYDPEAPASYALAPEEVALVFLLGNFFQAFVQALGQRAADGAAKLPKRVSDLVRRRVGRKGKPDEYHIGVQDGSTARIVITADTPDEARLALLDLDVTADAVRGKVLRWDSSASAWRPDDD